MIFFFNEKSLEYRLINFQFVFQLFRVRVDFKHPFFQTVCLLRCLNDYDTFAVT